MRSYSLPEITRVRSRWAFQISLIHLFDRLLLSSSFSLTLVVIRIAGDPCLLDRL